jgi:hypothetical protein
MDYHDQFYGNNLPVLQKVVIRGENGDFQPHSDCTNQEIDVRTPSACQGQHAGRRPGGTFSRRPMRVRIQ